MIEYNKINIRSWSMLGSCGAFGVAMSALGETEDNLAVLTADLRFFSGLDRFANFHPQKFFNMGIAEQNMLGMAAGMANEGMNVFATTYATFASSRIHDQIRVNMGYMKQPVRLVGLVAGFSSGILGPTHMSLEDITLMRTVPNITILSPADCTETVKAVIAAAKHDGPVYLRLTGAMNNPIVYKEDYDFQIGKSIKLLDGEDIAIIATGTMVHASIKAAELLKENSINASVIDMHTIKPLDKDAIDSLLSKKLIVTIEEHSKIGGLGGAVAEYLSLKKIRPMHLILGMEDYYPHAAEYGYLLESQGLTPQKIADKITKTITEVLK